MKSFLLIGVGRFGKHIAMELCQLRHEVLAVDWDEKQVNEVLPFVTDAKIGDATDRDFLQSLGVKDFDVCLVSIGDSFENSLIATALLKELGARFVVSMAGSDLHADFLRRNGADDVVFPERQVAVSTAMRYSSEQIFDYMELTDEYGIYEVSLPRSFAGKTLQQLDLRRRYNLNVLATKQGGHLNPAVQPDKPLAAEETMLVLGRYKDIQKCFHV